MGTWEATYGNKSKSTWEATYGKAAPLIEKLNQSLLILGFKEVDR